MWKPSIFFVFLTLFVAYDFSICPSSYAKERSSHPRQTEIDSLYNVALGHLSRSDGNAAISPLREILNLDPKNDQAYLRLGDAYLLLKNTKEAMHTFKEALSIRKTSEAYDGLGRVLMEGNDIQAREAIEYFQYALGKDPNNYDAQYHRTLATWRLRDMDAKSQMDIVLKMRPDDWRIYILLAEWYRYPKVPPPDWSKAIYWYERYLKAQPDSLNVVLSLGNLYLRTRHYDNARDLFTTALQRKPDMIQGLPILAQACMGQGDFEKANAFFSAYLDKVDATERAYYEDISLVGKPYEVKTYNTISYQSERQEFLRRFWMERNPTLAEMVNRRLLEHYRRVWVARNWYGEKYTPWDRRGEVYIRYGEPDYRSRSDETDFTKMLDPRVQRVKERLSITLYGTGASLRYRSTVDAGFGSYNWLMNREGVSAQPVYPVRDRVPWESWIYFNIGGGIEITFTDERMAGTYDYAPIVTRRPFISNSPQFAVETVASATPAYYQTDVPGTLVFGTYSAGFRGEKGKTRLEVYTGVPLSEITFNQKDSNRVASVERSVALFDQKWREVGRAKDVFSLSDSIATNKGAGAFIPDVKSFDLMPGDYHLAVQVTDQTSHRIQVYRQTVRVDNYGQDSLHISDIELAGQITQATEPDPFVKNGLRILPMPSRAYRQNQGLFLYCEVYNLKPDAAGQTHYRVDYTIRSKDEDVGANIFSALGRLLRKEQKRGEITVSYEMNGTRPADFLHAEFNAQEVGQGDHFLRVAVTDLNNEATTTSETAFWIQKQTENLQQEESANLERTGSPAESGRLRTLTEDTSRISDQARTKAEQEQPTVQSQKKLPSIDIKTLLRQAGAALADSEGYMTFGSSTHVGQEEAHRLITQALLIDPKSAEAHAYMGVLLREEGDLDGAIPEWRQALKIDPQNASVRDHLANALYVRGDPDSAISEWRQAIQSSPQNASIRDHLANALYARGIQVTDTLMAKGDLDGVIQEWRQIIGIDPEIASAHNRLGNALMAKEDTKGAINEYHKAIQIDSGNASAHYNLGVALMIKGDLDGAVSEYRKTIQIDSNYVEAHHNLGVVLRDKGDLDGAVSEYRKTIQIDSNVVGAYYNLGNALMVRGDLDGAIRAFRQAIRINPQDASVHHNLGVVFRDKGDIDGAISEYRKAIKIDPENASTHYNLGLALKDKGDRKAAIEEFRVYIRLIADQKQKKKAQEMILELGGRL